MRKGTFRKSSKNIYEQSKAMERHEKETWATI